MKIIAIIPAREGSKGIPYKNIKTLAGKPLIAYTIEAALKSKFLDRVIVSTDSKKIAKIAKESGADVPFLRPKRLAGDKTAMFFVVKHAVSWLKNKESYSADIVAILQPTSPLRTGKDIDKAIKIFLNDKCESVVSVSRSKSSLFQSLQIKRKYLKPILGWQNLKRRRQDLPTSYIPNGAIFIASPQMLDRYESFFTAKTLPYIMSVERSLDIDSKVEFKLAGLMIKR